LEFTGVTATDHVDTEAFVTALLARPPFHHWLLPKITASNVRQGTITINLPYRAEFARSPDQNDYHGGIIATLIDLTGRACLAAKLGQRVPTIDMRVDYLRGAVDTDPTANARILRTGSSVGLVDVDVRDNAERAVATGRCVFSTREN
jgi:uncharacterized protein (TIGR00369 family)